MPKIYIIQINVDNLEEAIEWYCGVLEFKVSKKHYHYPVAVDLEHKDKGVRLILHKSKFIQNQYPPSSHTQIVIQVDDIEAKLRELKAKGVEIIHEQPLDFPLGKYAALKNPYGDIHELVELKKNTSSRKASIKSRAQK